MNTVYTYVVFHGQILHPPDFPSYPERKDGRLVVRFELPPKVVGAGLFDMTKADEYTMPSSRRRFTIRTVRHIGFANDYVCYLDAERIIEKRENVTVRKELHDAEKRVKDCKEELIKAVIERREFERQRDRGDYDASITAHNLMHRRDAETNQRLYSAQCDLYIAKHKLLHILLSLRTINGEEYERRLLECDRVLRGF